MLKEMGLKAKKASYILAAASTEQKNQALLAMIENLKKNQVQILKANEADILAAKKQGLEESLIDRLSLINRFEGILADIGQVVNLPDPIGETFHQEELPNQLTIEKMRTPLGVIGVIYEARPNVTIDIAALTLKSGNCVILRGGSETLATNREILKSLKQALADANLPLDAIQMIDRPDRELVNQLLKMHEYVDLIIPRGSAQLQQFCRENSTIPVVTGGIGICHLFVDKTADLPHSLPVILNAKIQRPTVCNALDTLLVHQGIAPLLIPQVLKVLGEKGVSFKLDEQASQLAEEGQAQWQLAKAEDWDTEWLSLVLGIKIVKDIEEAIAHIRQHSSGHSDGILTEDLPNAELFIKRVDSAAVYVNASTRFTDGAQFGLGAEIAISTQKLHARGPMGLKELTSYKWIVIGDYQARN